MLTIHHELQSPKTLITGSKLSEVHARFCSQRHQNKEGRFHLHLTHLAKVLNTADKVLKMSPWLVKQTVIIKVVKKCKKRKLGDLKKKKKGKFPNQRQAKKVLLKVQLSTMERGSKG